MTPQRAGPAPTSTPPVSSPPASAPPAAAPPATAAPAPTTPSTPFQWLAPQINRHDAAKRMYDGWPGRLYDDGSDTGGGLTRMFVNDVEITDSQKLSDAIGWPSTTRRTEANGATTCWFTRPVSLIGQSVLDVYSSPPWRHVVPKSDAAQKPGFGDKCAGQTGDAEVGVACPDKTCAELEAFILNGEMEHEADDQNAFHNLIVPVGAHINAHAGDTPATRVQGATAQDCTRQLFDLAAVKAQLNAIIEAMNAQTAVRHQNDRHSVPRKGTDVADDCSRITFLSDK